MTTIKLIGGVLILIFALYVLYFVNRQSKKENNLDELISRSINFQGYIFFAVLLMSGVFLIIDGIKEIKTSKEIKTNQNDKVVIHRRK